MRKKIYVFADWEEFAKPILVGSSLGGARPKSCVVDDNGELWIAKFPNHYDDYDIAAWEFVAYKLARDAGINMSECRLQKFNSRHNTFLTRRFDRTPQSRLHFTSAMTQLGYDDGTYDASYLELAQFLTDHGFIYKKGGWLLSPAFDINPVASATGLHLNITDSDNSLNYKLAMEVIEFFQLSENAAQEIKDEVLTSVGNWEALATKAGLEN